jgi:tRNA-specific 2-thiouridylase
MSGGVDSSVAAVLRQEQGFEVIGDTMELYHCGKCCNPETYADAKSVCNQIGIPHFIFDFQKEFQTHVIDDFISCYANCKTPNPCIECNKYLKFGYMFEKAKELGCDYIATGHYAKTEYSDTYNRFIIKKSNAGKKDQSYVLWSMPKEVLGHILFPLGEFNIFLLQDELVLVLIVFFLFIEVKLVLLIILCSLPTIFVIKFLFLL